jgi:AraC-like DNA-binding protein
VRLRKEDPIIPTPVLLASLYSAFREISGIALVTGGATFLLSPQRDFVNGRLGLLLLSGGFLFCLSSFDPEGHIPVDIGNFLILAALLATSQALVDIVVYLFAEEPPPFARWIGPVGAAWSLFIWLFPFADYLLGSGYVLRSIEDGTPLGPFHVFAAYAIYAWPLLTVVALIPVCRIDLRTIDLRRAGTKFFGIGSMAFIAVLACALVGVIADSVVVYRIGHTLLEIILLVWYFVALMKPSLFSRAREAIQEEKERLVLHDPKEAALIGERVAQAIADMAILGNPDLDLRSLAAVVKVPPYRLSNYFNGWQDTTFPAWLNARRVERIKALMLDFPERTILDLAMEVGFGSKSVFNEQFRRIAGMNPSDWRRSAKEPKALSGIPPENHPPR